MARLLQTAAEGIHRRKRTHSIRMKWHSSDYRRDIACRSSAALICVGGTLHVIAAPSTVERQYRRQVNNGEAERCAAVTNRSTAVYYTRYVVSRPKTALYKRCCNGKRTQSHTSEAAAGMLAHTFSAAYQPRQQQMLQERRQECQQWRSGV